jgi:hypothetical protein
MSPARVLPRVRRGQGRVSALGVLFLLLTLVPLAHTSPSDAMWIAGVYDGGDFDEVVWTLIGADFVGPPVRTTGAVPLLPVSALTRVGISPVVAGGSATVRPRSPPRI